MPVEPKELSIRSRSRGTNRSPEKGASNRRSHVEVPVDLGSDTETTSPSVFNAMLISAGAGSVLTMLVLLFLLSMGWIEEPPVEGSETLAQESIPQAAGSHKSDGILANEPIYPSQELVDLNTEITQKDAPAAKVESAQELFAVAPVEVQPLADHQDPSEMLSEEEAEANPDAREELPLAAFGSEPDAKKNIVFRPTLPEISVVSSQLVTAAGDPYSVGRIEVQIEGLTETSLREDEIILLTSRETTIRYPAFKLHRETDPAKVTITAHFLFLGKDAPKTLVLRCGNHSPVSLAPTLDGNDLLNRDSLVEAWWSEYSKPSPILTGELFQFDQDLKQVIATRMGRVLHENFAGNVNQRPMAKLEDGFERVMGTLMGFDSVLLSMPDYRLSQSNGLKVAPTLNLPAPMRLQKASVPITQATEPVEAIAWHVPQECYYVRCSSVRSYDWLRNLMVEWGGSLDEIVSMPTMDYLVRKKLEHQLAIDYRYMEQQSLENAVSDFALIGTDVLFHQGTGIGIVFEAKDPNALQSILLAQRRNVMDQNKLVSEETVILHGGSGSLLSTPDHSIRSFYLQDGKYHLITNSSYIAERFMSLRTSKTALGNLPEFRYAKNYLKTNASHLPTEDSKRAFLYVSDPFFNNVASPKYRVELGRRAASIAELRRVNTALLVAQSEGQSIDSVSQLIDGGYLPESFAKRADGSQLVLTEGKFVDSLRGIPGSLIPIPDMQVERATNDEIRDFSSFASRYRREWAIADPVVVEFASRPAKDPGEEIVSLNICVTPYARRRYEFLANNLAPPSNRKTLPLSDDLLGMSATLRNGRGVRELRIGIKDSDVPFQLIDGEVVTAEPFAGSSLFDQHLYAAVTPAGEASMDHVQQFAHEMNLVSGSSSNGRITQAVLGLFVGRERAESIVASIRRQYVTDHRGWTIAGRREEVRRDVGERIEVGHQSQNSQVSFMADNFGKSRAAPYIRAFAYLESRKASARNAVFLNSLTQQLGISPQEAQLAADKCLPGRLICPLGGQYSIASSKYEAEEGVPGCWTSSAWDTLSYYDVSQVPDNYQFPFLDWLRGFSVDFTLSTSSLRADIELLVGSASKPTQPAVVLSAKPKFEIDPKAALPEIVPRKAVPAKDESNGIKTGPDLMISSLHAEMTGKDRIRYTYTITNIGDETARIRGRTSVARDTVSIQAYVSEDTVFGNAGDRAAGGRTITAASQLFPGESLTESFSASVQWDAGSHPYLTLKVDWHDLLKETNEENNFAFSKINEHPNVPAKPRLQDKITRPETEPRQAGQVIAGNLMAQTSRSEVIIRYDLTNTNRIINEGDGTRYSIAGVRQHWIERLGADAEIGPISNRIPRDGRKYEASKYHEKIDAASKQSFSHRQNVRGYPPGKYRFYIRWTPDRGSTNEFFIDFQVPQYLTLTLFTQAIESFQFSPE